MSDIESDTNGFVATDRSWTSRIYHTDNAGLTHVRGGPNPDNHGFPGTSPGASFFSAYRMFDKDPLPFEGKLGMYWRNGGAKCSLPAGGEEEDVVNITRISMETSVVDPMVGDEEGRMATMEVQTL